MRQPPYIRTDDDAHFLGVLAAIFEAKALFFTLVKSFVFEEVAGIEIKTKLASSLQAVVVGQEERGPQLPLRVTAIPQ